MNAFLQRIRIPAVAMICFTLAYGVLEAFPVFITKAFGLSVYHADFTGLGRLRGFLFVLAAGTYGAYRVLAFYPTYVPGYRKWLATVPWIGRHPLPLGPVHPVLQDVLVIAALATVAYVRGVIDPLAIPIAAFGAYALFSLVTLLDAKRYPEIIAMFCVGPLAILLCGDLRWELLIVAALFALALFGLTRALARLPWQPVERPTPKMPIGWPFAHLGDPGPDRDRPGNGLFIGLLIGWWLFAFVRLIEVEAPISTFAMVGLPCMIGAFLALIRLAAYVSGYAPPISLIGRLRTGRWIIPGYDIILVAPVCTVLTAVIVAQGLRLAGLPGSVVFSVSVAASIAVATELGPDLRTWRLTGHHRIFSTLPRVKFDRL